MYMCMCMCMCMCVYVCVCVCVLIYTLIIGLLSNFRPYLRDRNQYILELGPSALLRAIRMCLRPKLDNSNNVFASSEALSRASCHLLCSYIITILFCAKIVNTGNKHTKYYLTFYKRTRL